MLRALPALLLLLLAACRAEGDPKPPPQVAARFAPPEGWTWGMVSAAGGAAVRYGVGSPSRVPRAEVVVVPPRGERAEVWFETARDLMDAGANVWVLERSAESLEADAANLRGLLKAVVRPAAGRPVLLLGQGDGALVALAAGGAPEVTGLIASAPERLAEDGHDPWRRAMARSWAAEPAKGAWKRSLREARAALREAPGLPLPALLIGGDGASAQLCARSARCTEVGTTGEAFHLAGDGKRTAWLEQVSGFMNEQLRARPQTARPEGRAPHAM